VSNSLAEFLSMNNNEYRKTVVTRYRITCFWKMWRKGLSSVGHFSFSPLCSCGLRSSTMPMGSSGTTCFSHLQRSKCKRRM